ncbi:AraC family transcriptional regulator [Dyadobacter luteus]|uniref:AraC family transcriptional regulator n=1 Tax=Dyadobacter luteus TaxID=2259619 RepID=A0A3D8YA36_9BACT|nr:AraC family transcriptional regulator [Dyadobacter luteus]REA60443.1 AraC family transcriptional regulator [Dyadobacter luteus]
MVKAQFESIDTNPDISFRVRRFLLERFTVPYHFHPEYELTLIVKGTGKRYVGNSMEDFKAGDLVFLGSDLPHCWKSDQYDDGSGVESIVIQFEGDFLGKDFFERPELLPIAHLLVRSAQGICFNDSVSLEIAPLMQQLESEPNPFQKLAQLLSILNRLAVKSEYQLLHEGITPVIAGQSKERINTALGYIVDHFRQEILLEDVSSAVNMSPNAFCKYFKKATSKTFIEMVNEYRINFAAQQLLNTDHAVSEICYESGFGDVSYFHKVFKKKMKSSPLDYRKQFLKSI